MSVANAHAGGHFSFAPTANSTRFVRAAYEGEINGLYEVDVDAAKAVNGELAGRIAAISADGRVVPCGADAKGAVGLIREDLVDMVNASNQASFYFRGGEYHVAESRLGAEITTFTIGKYVTTNATGQLVSTTDKTKSIGTVVSIGEFRMGNMFEWAGEAANGGKFLGFILNI